MDGTLIRPQPRLRPAAWGNPGTAGAANSGGFDAVVDLHVPPLDDPYDGTYYIVDRVHWTPAGAQAAAELIAPALETLLTP